MATYPALTEQAGTTTQVAAPDKVSLGAGAVIVGGGISLSGFTTAAFASSGLAGYNSAAKTVTLTDNAAIAKSRMAGVSTGNNDGNLQVSGEHDAMQFTTAGGAPANGAPVFLAAAADDGATGAGKLTATAPVAVGSVVAEVGICIDPANYAGAKTAKVLLQPKTVIQL